MVMAATFTGALSLVCQMQGAGAETVRISVRDGVAQVAGLEDAAVQHGMIANRGPRGALRLVAITLREPERDIWADLTPNRRGEYALAFHSAPHGVSRPSNLWGRGQCLADTQDQGTSR